MINEICEKSKTFLPLVLKGITWDYPNLNFHGDEWGFNTLSSWRVIDQQHMIFGCFDADVKAQIENFVGLSIVAISPQTNDFQIDPVFTFSNGLKLEIFSTSYFEPWTFSIPGGPFYDACPGVPAFISKGIKNS